MVKSKNQQASCAQLLCCYALIGQKLSDNYVCVNMVILWGWIDPKLNKIVNWLKFLNVSNEFYKDQSINWTCCQLHNNQSVKLCLDCSHGYDLWSPKVFMVSLLAARVLQRTMKIDPLTSMKNIGLSALAMKHSRIPINPMRLVRVRMTPSHSLQEKKWNQVFSNLKGIKNQLMFRLCPHRVLWGNWLRSRRN